jgi:NADP-dependent 3-hydroxy acid dehydrogenase YdfG
LAVDIRRSIVVVEQRVAVITGASKGIGAALVKAYRDRNYRVVATARSIKPLNDDEVLAVPGDIADRNTAERAISEGMARFGRIDTLVNNAGVFIANR